MSFSDVNTIPFVKSIDVCGEENEKEYVLFDCDKLESHLLNSSHIEL